MIVPEVKLILLAFPHRGQGLSSPPRGELERGLAARPHPLDRLGPVLSVPKGQAQGLPKERELVTPLPWYMLLKSIDPPLHNAV